MRVIPSERFPERTREGLMAFLANVCQLATDTDKPHIASISLKVRHIAPLAVLESIYEPKELHAYLEYPQVDSAVAAIEAVCQMDTDGENRFKAVKEWAKDWGNRMVCIGDMDTPISGPRFFCRFNFNADEIVSGYPPAQVFVPRWQVARHGGCYVAVANACIHPHDTVEEHVVKIWAAYQKFSAFSYAEISDPSHERKVVVSALEPLPEQDYCKLVVDVLRRIEQGMFEKVVLARAEDVRLKQTFSAFLALDHLREQFANCCIFSAANGRGSTFIGATPERLCRLRKGFLETEALAGTAPRGHTLAGDASCASALLASDKEHREHVIVRDEIIRLLSLAGVSVEVPAEPSLRQLANVQHLFTPLHGRVAQNIHILDMAEILHPTPAIAGYPREAAMACIHEMETFMRGPYAGCFGWFDVKGEGELMVALRCAIINGGVARLFAGAGIVAGSTPESENRETEFKLAALRSLLAEGERLHYC